jgi:hypothetical protein
MREIKWKKKIRQTNYSPLHILGHSDAAQLQRWSTDTVMITADVFNAHFGIHRRCAATASESQRCNWISPTVYWPKRLGWRQKVLKPMKTFTARLIQILTPLSSRWTVPLNQLTPTQTTKRTVFKKSSYTCMVLFFSQAFFGKSCLADAKDLTFLEMLKTLTDLAEL